jgi:hypothetical protein
LLTLAPPDGLRGRTDPDGNLGRLVERAGRDLDARTVAELEQAARRAHPRLRIVLTTSVDRSGRRRRFSATTTSAEVGVLHVVPAASTATGRGERAGQTESQEQRLHDQPPLRSEQ